MRNRAKELQQLYNAQLADAERLRNENDEAAQKMRRLLYQCVTGEVRLGCIRMQQLAEEAAKRAAEAAELERLRLVMENNKGGLQMLLKAFRRIQNLEVVPN